MMAKQSRRLAARGSDEGLAEMVWAPSQKALAAGAADGPRRDPSKRLNNVEGMIASSMKERKIEQ